MKLASLGSNMMLYPSRNFEYNSATHMESGGALNMFHPSLASDVGASHQVLMQTYARKVAEGKSAAQ